MAFSVGFDSVIPEKDDDADEFITGRNCILFLIDCRKEMYSNSTSDSYVKKCLQFCKDVMLEIARKPSNDLAGIVLYGTVEKEGKFAPDNVVFLQSLSVPSASLIKNITKLLEDNCSNLKQKYGTEDFPNLAHALHFCQSVIQNNNIKVYTKNIVLFTCDDHPYINEPKIEHRIRKQAEEYQRLSFDFDVIGLGKFDSSKFFKEIVLTARGELLTDWEGIDPIKNLEKLKKQLNKFTDKFTARLSLLHLGNNYKLNVSLYKLFAEPKKFVTKNVSETPVEGNSLLPNTEELDKCLENENNEAEKEKTYLLSDSKSLPTVGGKQIKIEKKVLASLITKKPRGFEILYFVSSEDIPLYFSVAEPYLMLHYGNNKNNKEVFATLLKKCLEKGKSIIAWCCLTKASLPCLVALQPTMNSTYARNKEHPPGFIVIRLPYSDMWLDVDAENVAVPSKKQIDAAIGIVKKTTLPYTVDMFSDHERKKRIAMIEALALEYDDVEEVIDDTDIDLDDMAEKLKSSSLDFMDSSHIEEDSALKRKASTKLYPAKKPANVLQLIKDGMAQKLTVAELRDFLKAEGVKSVSSMNKPMLISVAYNRFRSEPN